jgi:hypothetical protein
MSNVGRLLAAGNVAEVFECGSRVVKLYRSPAAKQAAFREAANHAAVEAMGLPVPAVWGVQRIDARWRIVFDRVKHASLAERMQEIRPQCLHSRSARVPVQQFKAAAGDEHRSGERPRRTAKASFAHSSC